MLTVRTAEKSDDRAIDAKISVLLRIGTGASASLVFLGGVLYLLRHGRSTPDYRVFLGVPESLRTISGIGSGAIHGNELAIIQFGLLLLIATPVARVVFSVVAFALQKDYLYVSISMIVLLVLLYSLIWY